jgi:hypothetical protein
MSNMERFWKNRTSRNIKIDLKRSRAMADGRKKNPAEGCGRAEGLRWEEKDRSVLHYDV